MFRKQPSGLILPPEPTLYKEPIAFLHAHNEYSLLDGAGTAKQHVAAAIEAGGIALAETNHGTLSGALHHMAACRDGGIQPLVGCEVYYRPSRKVQGKKEWLKVYYHLTLHAKNLAGWRSLMRIVSEAHRTGFYGKACVDDELLEKHSEGLICLTGCIGGRLGKSIIAENDREAEAWLRQLRRVFGEDLFVEIMPHDLDEQRVANVEAIRLADKMSLPVVATLDEHYPTKEWADTQDVLLMIATNQTTKKREKKRDEGEDVYEFTVKTLYHQTAAEVRADFARNHPAIHEQIVNEAIRNTLVCAMRSTPFLLDKSEKMPSVSVPDGLTPEDYLRRLCYAGLKRRGYWDVPEYKDGLDEELATFAKRGQTNYMLLVEDFITWCKSDRPVPKRVKGKLVYEGKKKPIMIGPGRGSAAGSKAAWCLGITGINPVTYRTQFVRFVNPDRVGLPDIDIDLPPDRVDEAESYLKAIHGADRVVDIIAHSTFGPRASLTDVGRVLDVPYDRIKRATKTIDDQNRDSLDKIAAVNVAVADLAKDYPQLWDQARMVQGMVARKSEHAGGVLILPGPVEDYIPVERTGGMKGKMLSSYGERAGKGNDLISQYGLVKLDVLRVAELTKQQHAVDLIAQRTGKQIDLDALDIHDDPYKADPKVMRGFKEGLLVGIFQFSATASKLTRQLKPDSVLDLALINAGIRPGPRGEGSDQSAARRKNGLEETTYWHEKLEPFLNYTYGEMFFQEQLIEVVHHLGGLTKANADIFRKIASKLYKDPEYAREEMSKWKTPIQEAFRSEGIDQRTSDIIWAKLLSFSDYSFNLAHAAGYAVLAYRDMWLKVYYPREFYAAFLSKGLSAITVKKAQQKQEAAREARTLPKWITEKPLYLLPPDIHESGRDYTVVEDGIRLGLESIKNIGPSAAAAIEAQRAERPFSSFADFKKRVPGKSVNITGQASLIMAGAFDQWGMRRDFTEEKIDELERKLIGISLTSVHSIAKYAEVIEGRFWTEDQVENALDGTRVTVMGEVTNVKEIRDKNQNRMAFVDLAYGANQWSCMLFSNLYVEFEELLRSRRPLMITGERSTNPKNGSISVKVKSLPPDINGESNPPVMDLEDFVGETADVEEILAGDSVYPEDLREIREPEPEVGLFAGLGF